MKAMRNFILITLTFLLIGTSIFADVIPGQQTDQNPNKVLHVVWGNEPIAFSVPTGTERLLSFPGKVELNNSSPELTTDKVALLNNNGTLYITAKKTFKPIRVAVTIVKTGTVILIDLSGVSNGSNASVSVLLASNTASGNSTSTQSTSSLNYASMMRFAITNLYSPARLMINDDRFSRTPMYTSRSVSLVINSRVLAMPLISWTAGDLTITAVLLKNTEHHKVWISPYQLKGAWLASSLYPTRYLDPANSTHDRTTLFLISSQPFNDALSQMKEYHV